MDASASLERIRSYIDVHRRHLGTPGLALAVTDRDRCLGVVLDGFANVDAGTPVSPHHRFQIGSISKGFTALAVLQQVEEGRIQLDAPVTEYLPWFEVRSAFAPITVHHLLSHTSGLVPGVDFTGEAASEVWTLRETETGFAPGERFLYSNVAYKALGLVLEAVTGRPWWETVRERVMAPIGMGDADVVITNRARERLAIGYTSPFADRPWLPRHGWAPSAAFDSATADGTICATSEELTAFARLLLNRGEPVVSPVSFERMTTPVAGDPDCPTWRYGYGVERTDESGRTVLGHSGGMIGFSAHLLADVDSGHGATVLANSVFGRTFALAGFAVACLAAESSRRPMPEVPDAPDLYRIDSAPELVGRYSDDAGTVVVWAEGTASWLEAGGFRGAIVATDDDDVFVVDEPELERFPIRFLREESAVIGALWGPRWLPREGRANPGPLEHPSEWARYPGRYASWNPWAPGFRVFLRRGELSLAFTGSSTDVDGEHRLWALPDGSFRFGETWSPTRVRFDMVVDERAQRAVFDAAPYYRTFVE